MGKLIEQYELVKEIKFVFEEYDLDVRGRIYKIVKGGSSLEYMWDTNYHTKLVGQFDVYIPSAPFGHSEEDAEARLLNYVRRFEEPGVRWEKNTYF